jgi:hypothetical protein
MTYANATSAGEFGHLKYIEGVEWLCYDKAESMNLEVALKVCYESESDLATLQKNCAHPPKETRWDWSVGSVFFGLAVGAVSTAFILK